MMELNPVHAKWFEGRGISRLNWESMQIHSGRLQKTGAGSEVIPDPKGDLIVFPYLRKSKQVNAKYRGSDKRFFQQVGGVKSFYNADILVDPALRDGRFPLVIVEGEMDLLAVKQAGNPFVVSVPDGAPPVSREMVPQDARDIDPEADDKYAFLYLDWEHLKLIKRIVIATDADDPGKRLAEELVRRLGRSRCSFVTFPEGCKDFNDIIKLGDLAAVPELINAARPYPVSGIYTLEELPPEPELRPVTTGFYRLDDCIKLFYPAFMVVTGFASHGKSTWVNQLIANLAALHGWKAAIASFEMRISPFVTETLGNGYRQICKTHNVEPQDVDKWINDNFVFIAPEPSGEDDQYDIDWLIDRAITAVVRHGIRVLVIDPWNEVEHSIRKGENLSDYTGRAIRALKRFGREFECLVIVVAHPYKAAINKAPEDLSLYDVADTAHFANKADFGVVVTRVGEAKDCTAIVHVKKVRYQPLSGKLGQHSFTHNLNTRTFSE